jgi:hypothetical protein
MTRLFLRVFAFICSVCPIRLAQRRWPGSLFGRITARIQRLCPFCSAYERLHGESVPKGMGCQRTASDDASSTDRSDK